jgi:hypothetical protein
MLREPRAFIADDRLDSDGAAHVATLNECAARLSGLRAIEINVSGPFARSKIAWKLATFQHAHLHRVVALIDGAAVAWNNRATLSAILSARAFMETLAVMSEVERRVTEHLKSEDLAALDALAQNGIFANRDAEWLKEHPESQAINATTYVQKFDKIAQGYWGHYQMLSERCHPNAQGHNFMFSELDRSDGTVRYVDERNPEQNGKLIFSALAALPLVETLMPRFDALILKVADLHHRIAPVGASSAPSA